MQAKTLLLSALLAASCAASVGANDRGPGRHGDGGRDGWRHGGPNVSIEPYIDLSRPERPDVDAPEFIMAEIGRCSNAGLLSFVDCLRPNHGSVMIRRLEACVQSETIPDDLRRVEACLPPASVR
jgi:hypothetical protein